MDGKACGFQTNCGNDSEVINKRFFGDPNGESSAIRRKEERSGMHSVIDGKKAPKVEDASKTTKEKLV